MFDDESLVSETGLLIAGLLIVGTGSDRAKRSAALEVGGSSFGDGPESLVVVVGQEG